MIGSGEWRMAGTADFKTYLVDHLALRTAYVTEKAIASLMKSGILNFI